MTSRLQLADGHLTYVLAGPKTYDVYGPKPGVQLGTVQRDSDGDWWAIDPGPPRRVTMESTRWEAATRLWGDAIEGALS